MQSERGTIFFFFSHTASLNWGALEYSQSRSDLGEHSKVLWTLREYYSLIFCSKKLHKEAFLSTWFLQVLGWINNLKYKREKKVWEPSSLLEKWSENKTKNHKDFKKNYVPKETKAFICPVSGSFLLWYEEMYKCPLRSPWLTCRVLFSSFYAMAPGIQTVKTNSNTTSTPR